MRPAPPPEGDQGLDDSSHDDENVGETDSSRRGTVQTGDVHTQKHVLWTLQL